jgi:chromate reductase, NAD(P)H dehydrogenase (quinone)
LGFLAACVAVQAEFVPDGAELTVETIHGIPLYDADVETADGIPERVSALKEAIVAAESGHRPAASARSSASTHGCRF